MSTTLKAGLIERAIKGPEGFRQFLVQLGPTFIKIGQFLALRPDLVPQRYCDELMKLLDRVPPFPWAEAKAVLVGEFGRDLSSVFAYLNPRPVGAGSLAQTHFARLADGAEVAVKILRPNIRATVLRDLRRARFLVRLLELSGWELISSPREVLQEISDWLMQEIDFTHELSNMTRLYDLSADSPDERVPRPHPDLSTKRVLVAEYMRGLRFTTMLRMQRSGANGQRRLRALGIDRERLAENLLFSCLNQIFRYQFFHADLHPGNLIALPGDVIGFVDFGLCDELDAIVRQRQLRYIQAVYTGDIEMMFRSLVDILIPTEQTDLEAFRRDFIRETEKWQRGTEHAAHEPGKNHAGSVRTPTGQWMIDVMRTARRHGLRVPPRILSMYRALVTAESVACQLDPGLDLRSVGGRFFDSLQRSEVLRSLEPDALQAGLLSLFNLVRDSPGQLQQVLSELSDGRFSISVTTTESPRTVRTQNRRTRLLVTAIISVGVALLLARPALPSIAGVSLAWPLGLAEALLYISMIIQWSRFR